MTVSSKGQIVLPAEIRRRLGLMAGAKVEIIEEADGLRLIVQKAIQTVSLTQCAGMVTAKTKGKKRDLADFDAAVLTKG